MAQFYSLEEAARVLGMSPDDLKTKAQHREVRAFLDGGSWRFRVADVDELARRRGLGSDPELHLSDLDVPTASQSGDDLDLSEFNMGAAKPALGEATTEHSHQGHPDTASDQDILLDDLSLPPNPVTGSSSVIIGMEKGHHGKLPSDSDVRLVPDNVKGASDSDVRLASPSHFKAPSDSDVTLIADDTGSHDAIGAGSGETMLRPAPRVGSSAEVSAQSPEADSDFELTPSSVIDALQPDSGSDFELSALEGSDEFESTPLAKPSDSDVTAAEPGLSGINLSRPSDSGINLQMASGLNLGQSSSIELAPLSGDDIKTAPKAKPKDKEKEKAKDKAKQAMSATLHPGSVKNSSATLHPGSIQGKDIFDDTDFEVDALASDSESDDKTMQLEAASDFELEESDTGSEVFAIDEEDVDQNAATSVGAVSLDEDEGDSGEFTSGAGSGEVAAGSSAWDVESEAPAPSSGRAPATMLASTGPGPEWGGLWVGFLAAATVFLLLLAFVSMDLAANLYEFRNDTPASGLVKIFSGFMPGASN